MRITSLKSGALYALAAFATTSLLPGCGGAGADAKAPVKEVAATPVAVKTARVGTARATRLVRATGSFYPDDEVNVAAEAAGRVLEIGPEVGERVPHGALLARVDSTDSVLMRDQRTRVLTEILTKLGLERLPEGDVDFEALPSVEKSRLESANAKSRYDRAVRLRGTSPGTISEQDVADLKLTWDVAESALRASRLVARTDLAMARTRASDLAMVEKRLKDAEHRAPEGVASWLVAERRVAVGDYVSVGSPLYRLLKTDPMRLRARVPERRLTGMTQGRPVSIQTAGHAKPVAGKILRVRPEVDLRTRTYEVEVEVPNADGSLAVGAFALADVDVGEDPAVPVVPLNAIVTFAGVTKLVVPKEGKAAEKRVTLGRRLEGGFEIVEGAAAGDVYVVEPPNDLVPGTPLKIEEAAAPGAGK